MPTEEHSQDRQLSDVLSEFARTMATDFAIQAILDHLIERIVEMLPVSAAGVTLISPGEHPRYIAASDSSALLYEKLQTELGEGPCLDAYNSGMAVQVPDLLEELRFPRFIERALDEGLRAVFTFPLRHANHQLGALDLYRLTPGGLSDRDLATCQTLADVAAAYLINAQAREELKDSSERSRLRALHDGLTGLPNRTLMLELLEHAFARNRRTGKICAVIFINLDGFKAINDTHGHGIGDQLLVSVAGRLGRQLRASDTVARLHGDEFVVLCEDLGDQAQADQILNRIAAALARPFLLSTLEIGISASMGIAFADHEQHDPKQVLRDADAAMYEAKRHGASAQKVFDPRTPLSDERTNLEHDLHDAIDNDEMHLAYQPIVDSTDGEITGFEALLRWDHPRLGAIPPVTFIALAEQSDLINIIGRWVLNMACAAQQGWPWRAGGRRFGVSVNTSTQQIMAAGYPDTVFGVMQAHGTTPAELTLEVTESVFIRDSERAMIVLRDLKKLGVCIALDDFGTGYSSLSYLNRFPVDTVKIDRTFVASLGHDATSEIIVSAVVQLAHALAMTVVAEGIETIQQHRAAAALGCDSSQGYYFAYPMLAADVDSLIAGGGRHLLPLAVEAGAA